jgi:hypothetical protein
MTPRRGALAGAALGALATTRAAFGFVPLLAGAGLWRRDRRLATAVAVSGTVAVVVLHAAFVARTGWDGYTPVQLVLEKSRNDLGALGAAVVVAGAVGAAAVIAVELRRPQTRVDVLLLAGVGGPMVGIALAGLVTSPTLTGWEEANYFVDTFVVAASALGAHLTGIDRQAAFGEVSPALATTSPGSRRAPRPAPSRPRTRRGQQGPATARPHDRRGGIGRR